MKYEKGKYYHLYNRGCNKDAIFQDESDYRKLMHYIKESEMKDYLRLCAFALMPNHYHFLVLQTSDKPVSNWIKYIFNQYTQFFNHKYGRKGTIFEGRVQAKEIYKSEYMSYIVHYIHNNPKSNEQKRFCSITFLNADNDMISLDFYNLFFNGIENYWKSFNEYLSEESFRNDQ